MMGASFVDSAGGRSRETISPPVGYLENADQHTGARGAHLYRHVSVAEFRCAHSRPGNFSLWVSSQPTYREPRAASLRATLVVESPSPGNCPIGQLKN